MLRIFVLLVLLLRHLAWGSQTGSPAAGVLVGTEAEFLAALRTPSAEVIHLSADIIFSDSSRDPSAEAYQLDRNVTITSSDDSNEWLPTLDFNYAG